MRHEAGHAIDNAFLFRPRPRRRRLTSDGRFYLLEANPNPNAARDDYFSDPAKKSGLDYEPLLQKLMPPS